MQQNITNIQQHSRWNTEGRKPSWYRDQLVSLSAPDTKVGHSALAKRMFIGSGEDCIVDELNVLTQEEVCTL